MKVPELGELSPMLQAYKAKTGKEVILMIDATFAPGSHIMLKLKLLTPELAVMVFLSMSKSVSRGLTTAGALIANHTDDMCKLINEVSATADMLDARARPEQLLTLTEPHFESATGRPSAVCRWMGRSPPPWPESWEFP